ncbi:MAG: hypothetical protein KGD63_05230, partial [Candidatus Lokiarchaeota archaeon]|nr:hypothetical protein [Candidatus Lokiarchaeota archaeon]
IEISPPDEKAREIIFNIHLKNKPLAKDLSIQDMVKRLYGYTGADILTTECPFCFRNFYDANEKYNHELKVIGLLELIDKYDLMEIIEKPDDNYILNLKRLRE